MPTDRHRRAPSAALATIVVAAVVLAACSSSGGDDGDAGGTGTDASPTVAATATAGADTEPTGDPAPTAPEADPAEAATEDAHEPSSASDDPPPTTVVDGPPASPLAEYVTGVPGANRFDPAQYQRESRDHEEAIARCMAAEGFEYVPYVRNIQWAVVDGGALAVLAPGADMDKARSLVTAQMATLQQQVSGDVLTDRIVIPEGWNLAGIAPRIAALTGQDADSILAMLTDSARARALGVPGPTLEGYLYPATYVFPVDGPLEPVLERLTWEYKRRWTPALRERFAAAVDRPQSAFDFAQARTARVRRARRGVTLAVEATSSHAERVSAGSEYSDTREDPDGR